MASKTIKKKAKGQTAIPNDEHLGSGNCKKVLSGILVPPAKVSSTDIHTTALFVGKGNICRIRVSAANFVIFGASTLSVPDGTEQNSLELNDAGVYLVVAAADYVMMKTNPARFEVIDAITDAFGTADASANPSDLP